MSKTITRLMQETVEYGGLLVSRYDMYQDLETKGVLVHGKASPAAFAYMNRPAIAASREWRLVDGAFHSLTDSRVIL